MLPDNLANDSTKKDADLTTSLDEALKSLENSENIFSEAIQELSPDLAKRQIDQNQSDIEQALILGQAKQPDQDLKKESQTELDKPQDGEVDHQEISDNQEIADFISELKLSSSKKQSEIQTSSEVSDTEKRDDDVSQEETEEVDPEESMTLTARELNNIDKFVPEITEDPMETFNNLAHDDYQQAEVADDEKKTSLDNTEDTRTGSPSRNRSLLVLATAIVFLSIGYNLYDRFVAADRVNSLYEKGLIEVNQTAMTLPERRQRLLAAEGIFNEALAADHEKLNSNILQTYGFAYQKIGFYNQAFMKFFGKISPQPTYPDSQILQIKEITNTFFFDQYGRRFIIEKPGAYLNDHQNGQSATLSTLLSLATFHSNPSADFTWNDPENYKNNALALNYLKAVFKIERDNIEALLIQGDIFKENGNINQAITNYQSILNKEAMNVAAHSRILDIWLEQATRSILLADIYYANILDKYNYLRKNDLAIQIPWETQIKLLTFYNHRYDNSDIPNRRLEVMIKRVLDDIFAQESLERIHQLEQDSSKKHLAETLYFYGKYLRDVKKESARSYRLFERAAKNDSNYYPALLSLGKIHKNANELNMAQNFFERAITAYSNVQKAAHPKYEELLGSQKISEAYFYLGEITLIQYANFPDKNANNSNYRVYPLKSSNLSPRDKRRNENLLKRAIPFFDTAIKMGLDDKEQIRLVHYWQGWIYYLSNNYASALDHWLLIKNGDPILDLALGNAFFHQGNYETSLNLFLQSNDQLKRLVSNPQTQFGVSKEYFYLLLSTTANNIGATYKHIADRKDFSISSQQSLKYYYQAIEYSANQGLINEVALLNLQKNTNQPILDDWLPVYLLKV